MVTDDRQKVDRLPLLSAEERHLVLEEWNNTKAEYPSEQCVHELFEAQVAKTPDAVAVVHEAEQLTYTQLNTRANQLAYYLRELGVRPNERIVTLLHRSIELVVAELAILKCGAAYVPIDPAFPDERKAFLIVDSGAKCVLTVEGTELPQTFSGMSVSVDQTIAPETERTGVDLNVQVDSESVAYIMYTSGSTGQPKGVMVPHRAINRLVLNNGYVRFKATDRVAFAANPAFDATTMEVWAPLLNGGSVVVIDEDVLLDPKRFGHALKQYGISVLWLAVGLFNQYADELNDDLESLRYLIVGGDALDPKMIARFLRSNPPEHLINGYGPTESTTFAATHQITSVPEDDAQSIPIGRPIANTRIYILDGYGQPVPVGVTGELYISGAGVARGYLNRPELTAERFLADPFSSEPGARMYKTGDLGRWLASGNIEYLGRNDFQVKIRGFRIELGEIESRLLEHSGVREATVVAREDRPGEKRLVAYYAGHEEAAPGAEELRRHLATRVPEYMVPSVFVSLQKLPLTANGKLDRKALPAPEDSYAKRGYEAPEGETEAALAAIWAEVLKLERVGRDDN